MFDVFSAPSIDLIVETVDGSWNEAVLDSFQLDFGDW